MVLTLAAHRPERSHPLEIAEEVLLQRDIAYDASVENELMAELPGQWSHYRLWFNWQEEVGVLNISCHFETRLPATLRAPVAHLICKVNEKMWLGHFDLTAEDGAVMFRYGLLLSDEQALAMETVETLLDIALTECDRFYPALQGFIWGNKSAEEALALAIFDTAGEA